MEGAVAAMVLLAVRAAGAEVIPTIDPRASMHVHLWIGSEPVGGSWHRVETRDNLGYPAVGEEYAGPAREEFWAVRCPEGNTIGLSIEEATAGLESAELDRRAERLPESSPIGRVARDVGRYACERIAAAADGDAGAVRPIRPSETDIDATGALELIGIATLGDGWLRVVTRAGGEGARTCDLDALDCGSYRLLPVESGSDCGHALTAPVAVPEGREHSHEPPERDWDTERDIIVTACARARGLGLAE